MLPRSRHRPAMATRSASVENRWDSSPPPLYRGPDHLPGHRLEGPLLVEEQTTTVVVGPRDYLEVFACGDMGNSTINPRSPD